MMTHMLSVLKGVSHDLRNSISINSNSPEMRQAMNQAYNYEYTDTFGGEANYAWGQRGVCVDVTALTVADIKQLTAYVARTRS